MLCEATQRKSNPTPCIKLLHGTLQDQLLPQNAQEQIEVLAKELLGTFAPWNAEIVPRTALTVLWLATHRHEVDTMVAQNLVEAAGLSGRHNWALRQQAAPESQKLPMKLSLQSGIRNWVRICLYMSHLATT